MIDFDYIEYFEKNPLHVVPYKWDEKYYTDCPACTTIILLNNVTKDEKFHCACGSTLILSEYKGLELN